MPIPPGRAIDMWTAYKLRNCEIPKLPEEKNNGSSHWKHLYNNKRGRPKREVQKSSLAESLARALMEENLE